MRSTIGSHLALGLLLILCSCGEKEAAATRGVVGTWVGRREFVDPALRAAEEKQVAQQRARRGQATHEEVSPLTDNGLSGSSELLEWPTIRLDLRPDGSYVKTGDDFMILLKEEGAWKEVGETVELTIKTTNGEPFESAKVSLRRSGEDLLLEDAMGREARMVLKRQ